MTEQKLKLPEGIEADYEKGTLRVSDGSQELEKKMDHALVDVNVEGDEIKISTDSKKRNVLSVIGTYRSHADNMVKGIQKDYVYKMKGVYAHFPMNIKKQGDEIHIENFMGERNPRVVDIIKGVEVQVDGDELEVTGPDKEKVSQTAARIEQACKKGNRDPRTFQDGIYITEKNGGGQ